MKSSFIFTVLVFILSACGQNYTPKPPGYFRIDLPAHEYEKYSGNCPFVFEYPSFASLLPDTGFQSEPCWFNIYFQGYKAQVHLSYKPVRGNLNELSEDARGLVYKHTIKADAINESLFSSPESKVFGILYEIRGNAASNLQFYLTDSSRHFIRGALYFNVKPNKDSLAPLIEHFKTDITHLIETFAWNEVSN